MPTVEPPSAPTRGAQIWLGMLVLYLVWGSTYLGIAIAVDTIPPFLMAATRFLLAGLILLTWSIARERSVVRGRRPDASCATAPSSGRCCSAAGWASSPSASRPSRRASRPCSSRRCRSGSPSSAASSSASDCRAWRSSGSSSASSVSRSSPRPTILGGTGALDPARSRRCPALPDRLGDRLAVRLASGRRCRHGRSWRPACRCSLGGLVLSVMALGDRRVRVVRPRRGHARFGHRVPAT